MPHINNLVQVVLCKVWQTHQRGSFEHQAGTGQAAFFLLLLCSALPPGLQNSPDSRMLSSRTGQTP